MKKPSFNGFLSPKQVSKKLGVTEGTLANWRSAGTGPRYVKVGYHVILYAEDAVAYWARLRALDTAHRACV